MFEKDVLKPIHRVAGVQNQFIAHQKNEMTQFLFPGIKTKTKAFSQTAQKAL